MNEDTLKAILKKHGASLTKSRLIIFDLLIGSPPQSMQKLTRRAAGRVDRATIYRTIELFDDAGITHRLNIGWKYKIELSDVFLAHHHHFHCTNCNQTFNLPANPMLETMIDTIAAKSGYAPRGHQLETYGLCPACQKT